MGRRKTSSTCGLPGHQVHSPDGPWTAGRPPEESWECTSFGICKQLSLEHNMVKSPPLGVRDMITIFRKFYKKIISDDLKSLPLFKFFFNFYFYFILLYNTVLVLPYIDTNPSRVYMRSQT